MEIFSGRFKKRIASCTTACLMLSFSFAQIVTLENKNLLMDINDRMQTQVRANFPGSNALMNQFSNSEYLETKYFQ